MTATDANLPKLGWTIAQVAVMLNRTRETVERLIGQGSIPCIVVGDRTRLIPAWWVDQFLEPPHTGDAGGGGASQGVVSRVVGSPPPVPPIVVSGACGPGGDHDLCQGLAQDLMCECACHELISEVPEQRVG